MRFIGGFLKRDGNSRALLQELAEELRGNDSVTEDVLSRCLECDGMEEVLSEELSHEFVGELVSEKTDKAIDFTLKCLEFLEEAARDMAKGVKAGKEEEKAAIIANCQLFLTLILTSSSVQNYKSEQFEGNGDQDAPVSVTVKPEAFWDAMWTAPEDKSAATTGERLVDVAMNLLFLEGFTVQSPGASKKKKGKDDANAVRAELIWAEGVGPEREDGQASPTDTMEECRMQTLIFLSSILCGGAPVRGTALMKAWETHANEFNKLKAGPAPWYGPLLADFRGLEYVCDPARSVPFRAELFYSLLSIAVTYDPRGLGVPYAGMFSGTKREDNTTLCLQVLGLLLLDVTCRTAVPTKPVFLSQKPQEDGSGPFVIDPAKNVFGTMLLELSSDNEISNIMEGMIENLCMPSDERSAYLPNSVRVPIFLPDMLNLVFHLVGCEPFVNKICTEGETLNFLEGVVQVGLSGSSIVPDESLWMLTTSILLRFTSYRKVCVAMNEAFKGDFPDALPDFDGSGHDLVWLVAMKLANDHLATAQECKLARFMVQTCFHIMCNLSVYAEELGVESAHCTLVFFERVTKAARLKNGKHGISWVLPSLLETITNVVHYQYSTNPNVVYGLVTRRQVLTDLVKIASESYEEKAAAAASAVNDNGPDKEDAEWWKVVRDYTTPVCDLIEAIAPELELQVEKKEISDPKSAKELLPGSALGLLPRPPVFTRRSMRNNPIWFLASESSLMCSLVNGPSGVWDREDKQKSKKKENPTPKKPARGSSRERKSAESSSKRQGDRARSTSGSRRSAPEKKDGPQRQDPPAPPQPPQDPTVALKQQLESAAANGVDIVQLLLQMQAAKTPQQ